MNLFGTMEIRNNSLFIGGISTIELVKKFGTPLYLMDETQIRDNCKRYCRAMYKAMKKLRLQFQGSVVSREMC